MYCQKWPGLPKQFKTHIAFSMFPTSTLGIYFTEKISHSYKYLVQIFDLGKLVLTYLSYLFTDVHAKGVYLYMPIGLLILMTMATFICSIPKMIELEELTNANDLIDPALKKKKDK